MAVNYYGHSLNISRAEMFEYFLYLVGFRNHQGIPVKLTSVEEMFSDFGFEVSDDLETNNITYELNGESKKLSWSYFTENIIKPKMQELTKSKRQRLASSPRLIQSMFGIKVIDWKFDALSPNIKLPIINDYDFDEKHLIALGYIKGDIDSLKMARKIQFLEALAISNKVKISLLMKNEIERHGKNQKKGFKSRKDMSEAKIEDTIKQTNQDIDNGLVKGTNATDKYDHFLNHLGLTRNAADERMLEYDYDKDKVMRLLH